jgi:hypothetical protein
VLQHVTAKPRKDGKPGRAGAPYAAGVNAARLAGYGKNSKADTLSKHAHDLIRNPKILAAIREESIKVLKASHRKLWRRCCGRCRSCTPRSGQGRGDDFGQSFRPWARSYLQ